jgi:copper transport protein
MVGHFVACAPGVALAQEAHSEGGRLPTVELLAGLTHGIVQGAAVFLAGLAAFVALVWLPVGRSSSPGHRIFVRGVWALFAVLAVVGFVDLGVYAVSATGRAFGPWLLAEALFATTAGYIVMARIGLALLTTLAVVWATGGSGVGRWWAAAGCGGLLLATLVPESHAAADDPLSMLVIWLHLAAAAFWVGGLLAFPMLLGPLRALDPEERANLRRRTVRRFSRVATVSVAAILLTGLYGTLQYVSGPLALIGTPYGRALIMKLVMTVFLLATGGINLIDKGDGPLGRMVGLELALAAGIFVAAGFLTSLPPAD